MNKQLRFIYRYLSTRRWRRWLNSQTAMVVVISAGFLSTLAWTAPYSVSTPTQTPTQLVSTSAVKTESGPSPTPLPLEYRTNANQTIGITIAASVLVLIVVIGVLTLMPRNQSQ